jgi:hypothetical protein
MIRSTTCDKAAQTTKRLQHASLLVEVYVIADHPLWGCTPHHHKTFSLLCKGKYNAVASSASKM